jgi:hypothetical protein
VHLEAYTVATKLSNHRVAIFLAMHLNSMTYVTYPVARFATVEAKVKGLAGDLHKALHLGLHLANSKGIGRVGDIAIVFDDTVERNVVSLFDEEVARDAVHHNIVDGNAECRRETFKTLAQGFGSIVADILLSYLVKESSGDTRTDVTANLRESFPEEEAGITYELDFFFCLQQYHFLER